MILCFTRNGSMSLALHGDLTDIAADTVTVIHAIFNQLNARDPDGAAEYAQMITELINDPDSRVMAVDPEFIIGKTPTQEVDELLEHLCIEIEPREDVEND